MCGDAPRPCFPSLLLSVACLAGLGAVPAEATCPSSCPAPATWTQPFSFAGLVWERKSGCGGPGPNCWAPENAELVPGEGVHLRLTRRMGKWYAGEIRTVAPVPCGSYSAYLVGRTDTLDPNVVLGYFLYDDDAGETTEPCPDELDMESSRFGDSTAPNGHFVSYAAGLCGPADLASYSYALEGSYTTHQIDWAPGSVNFRMLHGHRCAAEQPAYLIGERSFASPLVPGEGGLRLHVNLWAFAGNPPTDQQDVEIVIRDIVPACAVLAAETPTPVRDDALAVRPNPARGGADLQLVLQAAGHVRVTIADVAGRRVATLADGAFPAGMHRLRWEPARRVAGVYVARLEAEGRTLIRRIVLLP